MATPVFVGRERELAKLQTFLEQAVAGHSQMVFAVGEAGMTTRQGALPGNLDVQVDPRRPHQPAEADDQQH